MVWTGEARRIGVGEGGQHACNSLPFTRCVALVSLDSVDPCFLAVILCLYVSIGITYFSLNLSVG